MGEILMVSKPVAPPWNDSSKNLVRDLATALVGHRAHVLSSGMHPVGRASVEVVYPATGGGFAPSLIDNARVLLRLLVGPRLDLWHFFFAPNPKSSLAAGFAARVRGVPTVQTVCSAPAPGADLTRVLFADRVVVLSRHTEEQLRERGVDPVRVRRVPPCVAMPSVDDEAVETVRRRVGVQSGAPLVVYPGDLEFSGAAERVLRAHARLPPGLGATLVMACRAKTPHAAERERALRGLARELGLEDGVRWVGELDAIHALLAAADVVSLPAEDLYAKMDLPMVLLEAMALGRPVVVVRGSPAEELAEGDAAVACEPNVEALASATERLLGDSDARARIGGVAARRAGERYAPAAMAAAYEALYDELLEANP